MQSQRRQATKLDGGQGKEGQRKNSLSLGCGKWFLILALSLDYTDS